MAQHLCQTQALLLASAKGSRNLGGWLVSASSRRATCCRYPSTLASCTRWQHHPPSSGDVAQATSSWPWDAVAVRVLLTVDNVVFLNSVFCISSATCPKYLILSSYLYGGGRLCTYCSATLALYFPSNCQKLEQIHWQYSCFCSELQSWLFMLLNHMVFLVRNHGCKIDFSSSHFFMMLPLNFAHYILVYYFK